LGLPARPEGVTRDERVTVQPGTAFPECLHILDDLSTISWKTLVHLLFQSAGSTDQIMMKTGFRFSVQTFIIDQDDALSFVHQSR